MFSKKSLDKYGSKKPEQCTKSIQESVFFDNGFFPIGQSQCRKKESEPKIESELQPKSVK